MHFENSIRSLGLALGTCLGTAALATLLTVGCGSAQASGSPAASPDPGAGRSTADTEKLVQAKCVACHAAPKAHALPREQVVTQVEKHHKRLTLSDAEWAALTDYLSAEGQGSGAK